MGGTVHLPPLYAFVVWTGIALILNDNDDIDGGGDDHNDDK
jgi:hypothetical protein